MRGDFLDERQTLAERQEALVLLVFGVVICVGFLIVWWMGWLS